jgi:hypothetical protein
MLLSLQHRHCNYLLNFGTQNERQDFPERKKRKKKKSEKKGDEHCEKSGRK